MTPSSQPPALQQVQVYQAEGEEELNDWLRVIHNARVNASAQAITRPPSTVRSSGGGEQAALKKETAPNAPHEPSGLAPRDAAGQGEPPGEAELGTLPPEVRAWTLELRALFDTDSVCLYAFTGVIQRSVPGRVFITEDTVHGYTEMFGMQRRVQVALRRILRMDTDSQGLFWSTCTMVMDDGEALALRIFQDGQAKAITARIIAVIDACRSVMGRNRGQLIQELFNTSRGNDTATHHNNSDDFSALVNC